MRRTHVLPMAGVLVVAALAAAAEREFNWVPSGVIAVGDRASEAASKYEACGEIQMVELAYRGEKPQRVAGRLVTGAERFVIRPASFREGPAWAHLVICRRVDTAAVPGPLTVSVGDKVIGEWSIQPPKGERRFYDAIFVIPRATFPDRKPPAEVPVTITAAPAAGAAQPNLSLGYRFYAIRDFDVIGKDWGGDVVALTTKSDARVGAYLQGLLAEGDHDWATARKHFEACIAAEDKRNPELDRLARVAVRRARLRTARAEALAKDPTGSEARPVFETHYRLGILAGAWGCWEDALAELQLATLANPTHADATYRLAEALEYNRLPIEQWAPLFERAGFFGESAAEQAGLPPANVEDILIAVHVDPVKDLCGTFSKASMDALQRDWRYVEQQVYGASLGAWKLRTHFRIFGSHDPQWVWQAGWIFLPPDETVPVMGTYDYSIGTAEYGSSHAGGVDCGVNGAGGAQIGPTRTWEVLLHEWNHEFDWVCVSGEQVPGYPVTHDSDGCGKQPIVSMGCGHRSSMHYYINRAQYRRHEASDPVVPEAAVREWSLGPLVEGPKPPDTSADGLAKWLGETGRMKPEQIEQLKKDWEGKKKEEQQRTEKPPLLKSQPPPKPVPDWAGFLLAEWNRTKLLDELTVPNEAAVVSGEHLQTLVPLPVVDGGNGFVDLRKAHPNAPDKCVAYARTFIYSPVDQEVRLWLGYNDTGAVWLNDRKIHKGNYYACAKWDDLNRPYMLANSGKLLKGWNCLAVKIERGGGDWGFSVHIVNFDNRPVEGLKVKATLGANEKPNRYVPPEAGKRYRWADVQYDYMELLPALAGADLATITGIKGLKLDEHRFLLTLPTGTQPVAGSRYVAEPQDADRELNNYLNWDTEAAAALRYTKDGLPRDLLLVRPEYYAEFLTLLHEAPAAKNGGSPADHVLGYILIPECHYGTVGSRGGRTALVIDAALGDYPADDVDLLGPD